MNNAISLDKARFWVRPYEFEGDGSHGVATAVASLEVGGKTRMFWLKTLENRLFFREVGRDESWNFGALEELSESEKSDLPLALANALASENYGRVVLPRHRSRPFYPLFAPDGHVQCRVPNIPVHGVFERKPPHTRNNNAFLDWKPGSFRVVSEPHSLAADAPQFLEQLRQTPAPLLDAHWERGSEREWETVMNAFFIRQWPLLERSCTSPCAI